ncbi:ribosomal RNA-processing protein [Medicago truncatula]|uniref:Ribosomal RNA-processing protein n=1 Tax=Medicago truncatula TaxID=3880 RepID=G7LIM6_MEDTR|nr:ribosomal RNA-processing protein [Medicago truncatula]
MQERKAKEALAAEGGWTVVRHHKGLGCSRVHQDFYRFQEREAQRNELMELQSKFEEDKKRLRQLRAARKFRPY